MSSTLAIQIGGFILLLIALAVSFRQVDRVLKQRDQAFKDQRAPGALGLGTCLSGLPGLDQPELVSCGSAATELIFLADEDRREVAGRQQAVFEFPGSRLGSLKANYLKILQMAPDRTLRRVPF